MQAATQLQVVQTPATGLIGGETPPRAYSSYEIHPAATLFPLMHGVPLGELAADIAENGLREPIILTGSLVLDGRNRLRACHMAAVEPRFVEWDGDGSPLSFVISRNLHRRHLNESQRAMVAARARELFEEEAAAREAEHQFGRLHENPSDAGEDCQKLRESAACANLHKPEVHANAEAAALLNVSTRSVATAAKVLKEGDEELIAAVDAGTVAVSDAATVVDLPKPKQREAIERVRSGKSRTLRQAARQEDEAPEESPDDSSRDDSSPAAPSPAAGTVRPDWRTKRLRGECQRLARETSKLVDRVEHLARSIGGHTLYTDRVHQGLRLALRAIHEYLTLSGNAKR